MAMLSYRLKIRKYDPTNMNSNSNCGRDMLRETNLYISNAMNTNDVISQRACFSDQQLFERTVRRI